MAAEQMEALVTQHIPRYRWTADKAAEGVDLAGKNVIVTGATSGIGIPTVIALARTGANVTFTARDESRGVTTVEAVKKAVPDAKIQCKALDLATLETVRQFAESWGDAPVHVLLHNAGVMASPFTLTKDGFEQQQQVNYIAVVLLTELLRPRLAADARVVIVSSSAHKRIPADADFLPILSGFVEKPAEETYNKWTAYAAAKSAALMYSNALNAEFAKEAESENEGGSAARRTSNALHPGGIMTGLQTNLSQEEKIALGWVDANGNVAPIFKSAEEGASTSVWACVSQEIAGVGGKYLENCEVTPSDWFSAPSNDPGADIISRLKGTAPHAWKPDDCAAVASLARAQLRSKNWLK